MFTVGKHGMGMQSVAAAAKYIYNLSSFISLNLSGVMILPTY